MKKEFLVDQRVKIVKVGGDKLENKVGTILGKSFVDFIDHYIILLDEPTKDAKAICITESCLEKI